VIPNLAAMDPKVSPARTVYVRGVGEGVQVGVSETCRVGKKYVAEAAGDS
jgi:hypothetical protein